MIDGSWLTKGQPYAILHWATVAADARRRGVGSFILGEADRIARVGGARSICGDTFPENTPMRQAALQHGYTECGTLRIGVPVMEPDRERIAYEKLL